MKKHLIRDTATLLLISLMLMTSLPLSSLKMVYAQGDMTFTTGETIDFTSTTDMTFWSGVSMKFGTGIVIQVIEVFNGDGILDACDMIQVVPPGSYELQPCEWWEVLDPLGNPLGEIHIDGQQGPYEWHIDFVSPGPIPLPYPIGAPFPIEKKIDVVEPCDYFVVHWPVGWYPLVCSWWEIIDPETQRPTGYEFHVDWTNESCEFHIDEMIPGPYILPFPWWELEARQKIIEIRPCDWFYIIDPAGYTPESCSWWEILHMGQPTGLEFHIDEAGGGMFHVDYVVPDPLSVPPDYPTTVRKKIDVIQPCEWFKVTDPTLTPKPCTWWKYTDPSIGDVEFHVDQSNATDGTFHIDEIYPEEPAYITTAYQLTAEKKFVGIVPCDWFKVIDPQSFLPQPCSWWRIVSPSEWAGVIFHVDSNDEIDRFHIDQADPLPPGPTPPPWSVTAEPYTPPEPWYWKPAYPDYAPSGMPDFDERQWGTYIWQDMAQQWSHCGPVSVANSLWWLDSEFEPNPIPPPIINDGFPLVQAYGQWDDHDPQNVPWLVEHLAYLMDTDGRRTGLVHSGTNVADMEAGLAHYLSWSGVNPLGDVNGDGIVDPTDWNLVMMAMGSIPGDPNWNLAADIFPSSVSYPPVTDNIVDPMDLALVETNMGQTGLFYEHTVNQPDFYYIEEEVERCQDVVLLLGYWIFDEQTGGWYRENGHYVTVAGVNSQDLKIAISDPMEDAFENGLIPEGRVPIPHIHLPPEPPYIKHNDAAYVSQDIYQVTTVSPPFPPCPGGNWMLVNYVNWQPVPPFFTVIEAAVITSPYNRDVAVTDIAKRQIINRGDTTWRAYINVTVLNEGDNAETFDVKVYAVNATNTIEIGTQTVYSLSPSVPTTLNFLWNTVGWKVGDYTIRAEASPLLGETDLADNYYSDGLVKLKLIGDLGGGIPPAFFSFDDKCDGKDLGLFLQCFKGTAPPEAMWLGDLGGGIPPTFFNYDGNVNGKDLTLFLMCFKGFGP